MKKAILNRPRSFWQRPPWKYLVSLHVGICLLVLLIAISILGTLISPLERAQALVYYSWWFETLLVLVVLNISLTTIHRIVYRIWPARRFEFQRSSQFYQMAKPAQTLPYEGTSQSVAEIFAKRGYRTATENQYGCARKGTLGRWGSSIAHTGVVTVLLASFISGLVAREGDLVVAEGETVDSMYLRATPPRETPLGFAIRCDDFETGYFPKTRIPSNFISSIAILDKTGNDAQLAQVEVNNTVKAHGWIIHQTSYEEIEGGQRYHLSLQKKGSSLPVTIDISPGQSRPIPGMTNYSLELAESSPLSWRVFHAEKVVAEGTIGASHATSNLLLRADQFEPDFIIGEEHKATSRSNQMNNPALHIFLYNGREEIANQWLFGRADLKSMMHRGNNPYVLDLKNVTGGEADRKFHVSVQTAEGVPLGDYALILGKEVSIGTPETKKADASKPATTTPEKMPSSEWEVKILGTVKAYKTILTLTRNPMIPFIYFGCAIIMLGLLVAFFNRRKTIYFWVDEAGRQLRVAGVYRLGQSEFDKATLRALEQVRAASSKIE